MHESLRSIYGAVAGTLLVVLMCLASWFVPPGWNFVVTSAAFATFLAFLGQAITQHPLGALINERKLMSLSRFQMVVWTVVILGGYGAFAAVRMRAGVPDPLSIEIEPQIWALLGISATSFAAAPIVLGTKIVKEPAPGICQETARAFNETEAEVDRNRAGVLYGNASITDARWTDMFEGDELKTTRYLDLGKVQMFFFTILLVISYAAMLFKTLSTTAPTELVKFPVLSEGMIFLLGISHAGYLVNKGVTRTKTA